MASSEAAMANRVDPSAFSRELGRFYTLAKAPRLRSIREFAEQEVVIPDGPFRGFRFSVERQPHVRLWFDEITSGRWKRHVLTGPVQSGKSLIGFVIPAMYHLFEHRETVILGLPSMEIAGDKWEMDIEPAIRASRYRDLIPTRGTGSRGGKFDSIQFKNGAVLKFMSGGGSDKKRSAFTSRVLIVTETDGLDEAGEASREADPLRQLEARTASYGDKARIYLECTVSLEAGRTWQEIKNGSDSRIALRCPHCLRWVTPGRESLVGWQGAEDEVTAAERSAYYCDLCGTMWTEPQRKAAHADAKLVHRGQEITEDGDIVGAAPRTFTLGYRYAAPNNFFRSAGEIGAAEWRAAKSDDTELTEREMCQFVWAIPPKPSVEALVNLDARAIAERCVQPGRGFVPGDADILTAGIDVHKYHIEWAVVAWRAGCKGHIVDYGVEAVPSDSMAEESAILMTLRSLRTMFQAGWNCPNVGQKYPRFVYVDSGYQSNLVYTFCAESGSSFLPSKGQGAAQRAGTYSQPKTSGGNVKHIGEKWHISSVPTGDGWQTPLVEIDVDHWKTWLHERWRTRMGADGSMELFHTANHADHLGFAKHQTSEVKQTEFDPKRGEITYWKKKTGQNHWLDTMVLACAAANACGVTLVKPEAVKAAGPVKPTSGITPLFDVTGDDRPFFVLDR